MINENKLVKIDEMADELGIDVRTLDEIIGDAPIIDADNDDILVLSIQLCGDSEMPEVDDEMIARLNNFVSTLETNEDDVTIFPLISKKLINRVLSALPENTEIALMME